MNKQRFTITEFTNASGTVSYRVGGYKRDGTRVRENFAEMRDAEIKQAELQAEYYQRQPEENALRATRMTDTQLRYAEAAFMRLQSDDELLTAVDHWLKHGRQTAVTDSPQIDEAFDQFKTWLETCELRELSRRNLRGRVNVFVNSVPNLRVSDVTPDHIDAYLSKRSVSPKSKDNDRRAVSRFFGWCIERPRRWAVMNPCREIKIARGDDAPPAILDLKQCEALLRSAEKFERGKLAPYVAVCLFGGLRPFEASRLTWDAVNLTDREIRLESSQTKTGRGRVVAICDTLHAWLTANNGKAFFPSNWRKDFDAVKAAAKITEWPVDVMRHTAISHYFRKTGSYGQTAEQFGNSEAIIKNHYQGRVTSEDTKAFYSITPNRRAK